MKWAASRLAGDSEAVTDVGIFHRRRDFADYVEQELAACPGMKAVTHHQSLVTAITSTAGGWHVQLDSADDISARIVILATGNPSPEWPFPDAPGLSDTDPQPMEGRLAVGEVGRRAEILVIGGGLTALDALHVLHHRGHEGRITIVTPEGMLPPVQTDWHDAPTVDWPDQLRGSGFLRFMRQSVEDDDWSKTEWQRRFEGCGSTFRRHGGGCRAGPGKAAWARWLALVAGKVSCRATTGHFGRRHAGIGTANDHRRQGRQA